MQWDFYVGTYNSPISTGVYRFTLDADTGILTKGDLAVHAPDAKYIALNRQIMAVSYREGTSAGVRLMRRIEGSFVEVVSWEQGMIAPCHVAFHREYLATTNYHEGTVFLYHFSHETLEIKHVLHLGLGVGCHQTLVSGSLLLVPCLEIDCIRLFDLEQDCADAGQIRFPSGCGPRHGVFSADGKQLWIVGERDNKIYSLGTGFRLKETYPILKPSESEGSQSAAIRISPDGRFLTTSTRGANLLTTWKIIENRLEQVQQCSCGGNHPRDFLFTPDGRYLLCANQKSGEVVCFSRDVESGLIGQKIHQIEIAQAVALVCWEDNEHG